MTAKTAHFVGWIRKNAIYSFFFFLLLYWFGDGAALNKEKKLQIETENRRTLNGRKIKINKTSEFIIGPRFFSLSLPSYFIIYLHSHVWFICLWNFSLKDWNQHEKIESHNYIFVKWKSIVSFRAVVVLILFTRFVGPHGWAHSNDFFFGFLFIIIIYILSNGKHWTFYSLEYIFI